MAYPDVATNFRYRSQPDIMGVGLLLWLGFGAVDLAVVRYIEPGRPAWYLAWRAIGVMVIGLAYLRLTRRPLFERPLAGDSQHRRAIEPVAEDFQRRLVARPLPAQPLHAQPRVVHLLFPTRSRVALQERREFGPLGGPEWARW